MTDAKAAADPAAVLDRLHRAAPGAEPEVLERLGPPDESAPDSALDFLFRRLQARFHDLVAAARESWGEPHFLGSVEEDAFPLWSDALLLATWWRGDTVVYLAIRHEAEGDSVTLEAGAHAREEIEELKGWVPGAGGLPEPQI
jgi:hypothetical protein